MIEITNDNMDILSGKTVIVDFWAEWCGPCKAMAPIFHRVAEKNSDREDVVFAKCNIDTNRELAVSAGIRSIPSFVLMVDGKVKDSVIGVVPEGEFIETIQKMIS